MVAAVVIYIIVCVVLVGLILLQQNQGGGLGILGGSSSSLLGTTQESFIGKVIKFMAVLFVLGAIFLSIMSAGGSSIIDEELPETTPTNEVPILDDEIDSTLDSGSADQPQNEEPNLLDEELTPTLEEPINPSSSDATESEEQPPQPKKATEQ